MAQPQRKSSWSFSLRDDEQSDSSQEEQLPQPQPSGRRSEHEQLIAEAEQEGVAEHTEPEQFDISLVEEGDVRFVETPFTIARRVAATRKRARKEEDELQVEPRPKTSQPLPPAAPPKPNKPKLDPPIKKTNLPRKTLKAPPATESKSEAPTPSKLSPPQPVSALSRIQTPVKATESERNFPMTSPPVAAATQARKPGEAVLASFSSPKTSLPLDASSSTASKTKGFRRVGAKSSFSLALRKAPNACDEDELGDAELGGEEASVLFSDDSSWDHRTVSSFADTLPSSPPPRSPPASRANGMMSTFPSNGEPRSFSDGDRAPQLSSDKTSSLAPLPSPKFKSKPSPRSIKPSSSNEGEDDSTLLSDDVQSIEEDQAPTFAPRTPRRNRNSAFAPLIPPRSQAQKPSSMQPVPSTPQKSSSRNLHNLSPPAATSPRSSRVASSPSRALPAFTPPRPAAPTTKAYWSTLSSRSRPSLVPTPSAYGSALDGIASTSAAATRFALPEFAPQGGGVAVRPSARGSRRMGFKPTESLSAFKARVEKEKEEEQGRGGRPESEIGDEAQEKILLGVNLRSVKPGTVVSVAKSSSKVQGEESSL
ncbi:hypothetical protein BCR35DRAFT_354858 [Leucosporidium creatinivorum]|uniref:Uncharacterized protein n=1 Tax=Leucosporidium creatinivorum TaxID=106004 RepID=A0A1Y2E520_9BASI|nr:hypothetical protein BCR35DRAFT_354858 [Leucosporidium creatinivorum]